MFKFIRKKLKREQELTKAYTAIVHYHARAITDECLNVGECLADDGDQDQLKSILASMEAHNDMLRNAIWNLQYEAAKGS